MNIEYISELFGPRFPLLYLAEEPFAPAPHSRKFASNVVYVPGPGFHGATALLEGTVEPSAENFTRVVSSLSDLLNACPQRWPTALVVLDEGSPYQSWAGLTHYLQSINSKDVVPPQKRILAPNFSPNLR